MSFIGSCTVSRNNYTASSTTFTRKYGKRNWNGQRYPRYIHKYPFCNNFIFMYYFHLLCRKMSMRCIAITCSINSVFNKKSFIIYFFYFVSFISYIRHFVFGVRNKPPFSFEIIFQTFPFVSFSAVFKNRCFHQLVFSFCCINSPFGKNIIVIKINIYITAF